MTSEEDRKIRQKVIALESAVIQMANVVVQMQSLLLRIKNMVPDAAQNEGVASDTEEAFKRFEELMARLRAMNEVGF